MYRKSLPCITEVMPALFLLCKQTPFLVLGVTLWLFLGGEGVLSAWPSLRPCKRPCLLRIICDLTTATTAPVFHCPILLPRISANLHSACSGDELQLHPPPPFGAEFINILDRKGRGEICIHLHSYRKKGYWHAWKQINLGK